MHASHPRPLAASDGCGIGHRSSGARGQRAYGLQGTTCRTLQTFVFFFQAEDGIRDYKVTGVQTCALPISWVIHDSAAVQPIICAVDTLIAGPSSTWHRAGSAGSPGTRAAAAGELSAGGAQQIGRASCRERV